MNKTLEENQAFVKAMHEVVEEAGSDYVFTDMCNYFDSLTFTPLCMVGRAMAKVGIDGRRFLMLKNYNNANFNATDAENVLIMLGYDDVVAQAASMAQRIQDGRNLSCVRGTWGHALTAFRNRLHGTPFLVEPSTMD